MGSFVIICLTAGLLSCDQPCLRSVLSVLKQAKAHTRPVDYCDTPTPKLFEKENLELYIRVKYGFGWGETTSFLLPSLKLFWPHIHVVIVFDAEELDDQWAAANINNITAKFSPITFRSTLRKQYTNSGLLGLKSKADPKLEWHGYQREHVDMMYADEIVHAKYIAIADSDAMVVTLVTPNTVFSDSKPRIIGVLSRSAMGSDKNWVHGIQAVQFMLKKDYVISCMSYFPVILKREHIRMFREHVERVHKKPFIEVYKEMFIMTQWYCHYSMMCNYVWHYHHDDYVFHYHSYVGWRQGWDSPQPNQIKKFDFLTETNKQPVVRASTHASYTLGQGHLYKKYNPFVAGPAFIEAFCFIAHAQCQSNVDRLLWKKACAQSGVHVNDVQKLLFRFESWQSWEWEPRIRQAQAMHYQDVEASTNWISWGKTVLNQTQPELWKKLIDNFEMVQRAQASSKPPR